MFRSAAKNLGSAATAAVATSSAGTSSAHCRAANPSMNIGDRPLGQKDRTVKAVVQDGPAAVGYTPEIDQEWLVTDLRQALDAEEVVFGFEEIQNTMRSVLSFAASRPAKSGMEIKEVGQDGEESDDGSEFGNGSDANAVIQAAEMQLTAPYAAKEDFTRMLGTLLHDKGVQSACLQALQKDPSFMEMVDSLDGEAVDISVNSFLPPSAKACTIQEEDGTATGEGKTPFVELVQRLAHGIVALGEGIKAHALGARDAIGKLFIKLGYSLHDMLGQPFGRSPLEEANSEEKNRAEMVGNALITVACAILTLVLVKRVHRIRFV